MEPLPAKVVDLPHLRGKKRVFADRSHAGKILGDMLESYRNSQGLILAVPAGGLPVAAVIQERIGLDMDIAVVSKITLPWNTEAGYGAVSFDGTVRLNQTLIARIGLSQQQIRQGTEKTLLKVSRRAKLLRGQRPFPDLNGRPAIIVDDGLASGFTMMVAIESVTKAGAEPIAVAVPTGHLNSVDTIAEKVDVLYCANIRGGMSFAVADAYEHWSDVSENELLDMLKKGDAPPK